MTSNRRRGSVLSPPQARAVSDNIGFPDQSSNPDEHLAFEDLYKEFSSMVYGVSLRVTRDPAKAEEVAQEVFLEVWRLRSRYETSKASLRGLIAVITHRRAVDKVRSEQASRNRDDRHARLKRDTFDRAVEGIDNHFENRKVRKALRELSEAQRQALYLAYFEGYTYTEVAKILGTPTGTVNTRIRDGLIRLRKLLAASDA